MATEKDKMLAGELYNPLDPELIHLRTKARLLTKALNDSSEDEKRERLAILGELLGKMGKNAWVEPPFFCDYGSNITLGDNVFFNFQCVVLDVAAVDIGSFTMFGPAVQIYTATHPVNAEERRRGLEFAKPITIGSDVWVGGGSILCPGVHIGDRAVIGAGSVVTRDIPASVVAAGNPCRVLRAIS